MQPDPSHPDASGRDPAPAGEQPQEHIPAWESNPPSGFTFSRRTLLIGGGALLAGGLLTGLSLQAQGLGFKGLLPTGDPLTLDNFTHFSSLITGFDTTELDPATAQALYNAFVAAPPVGASPAAASAATGGRSTANTASNSTAAAADATSAITSTATMTAAVAASGSTTATAGTAGGTPVATVVAATTPVPVTATMSDLLRKAGYESVDPPQTLEDIERRGVFREEPYASMANGVIEGWYSGLVKAPDGVTSTAAWLKALGWTAMAYTQAPGYCAGETGFWSAAPAGAGDADAVTA
jgi:hypothetical protein